ncbi:tautomerase family protein [Achromobacter xylosoxidans]|uniref:Tautomerase family protein n=1 Tax=Alcaligenes xylosoxydans xylosoxydans TaxID=85698 RepID=A0A424W429_ALCXX|nr:tautomerase family protein [Achromobacter xylosoxidans]MBC9903292.1 tautomerase family protein [Achromobacter xylosoxidans]MBD0871825.1 tautomerase family protein [Achromobacter xylosoxidans]QNP88209.1 tautomerase family protein [Achromobacter xylosoxidans]RPJ87995.1 tautomerase family protein [Achromobacter xylosoxidans]
MPLVHVSLRAGKPQAYRQAIFDNIYLAMRETFNVPEDDQFMTMTEHEASNFRYSPTYMDVARSDDLVYIQITANNTRSLEQKKALFQRIAQRLGDDPGLRPEDVFVNLVEVAKENWSFGHGLAQYA